MEVGQARQLAENDAPRAGQTALRLQASMPPQADDSDRALILNLRSRTEIYLALTAQADDHAKAALALARRASDKVGQAEALLNLALNAINQGNIDELVSATPRALPLLEGVDRPDLLGEALLRTGLMYRRLGQIDDSVALCVKAMGIARRSGNALALTYAYQGLAISYDQSERQQEARDNFLGMRDSARKAGSTLLEGLALAGLGGVEKKRGDPAAASVLIRQSIQLFRRTGNPFNLNLGLFALADNLRRQGNAAQALPLLDEVVASYARYPNRIGQWYTLNARSETRQGLGQLAEARTDAEHARGLANEIGFPAYQAESAQRLAAVADASGDHRLAYQLALEASQTLARATQERSSKRMVELTERYAAQSRQREIDELTQRNQLQAAELQSRSLQQRWLWTVLGGSVLALAGLLLYGVRRRQSLRALQAVNAELLLSKQTVQALNTELEQRVRQRTAALRQQARYLRTLIDMLPMWAWFKDTRGRYLVTNEAHARARGADPQALVGRSDDDDTPQASAASSQIDEAAVMASRERQAAEELLSDGGRPVWMETYKAAVLDEDGSVLGTVGVARDISERKAVEAAREAALQQARQLAQLRSDFLAQMSHELRTPLNAILGFAQLLKADPQATETQVRCLGIVEESGHHLLALVNDLLDLARIDAGKLDLHVAPCELPDFLQVVTGIIRVKADEKKLHFACELAADLPPVVQLDDQRLRQVLLNLLSNAVKFTDAGHVVLRVAMLVAAPVEGDGLEAHAHVIDAPASPTASLHFEVEDTGIGMTEPQLARLFARFEQVADARRRQGGSGLGLAISQRLVQLMGGEIRVRSRAGQGSAFSFEVPLLRPA